MFSEEFQFQTDPLKDNFQNWTDSNVDKQTDRRDFEKQLDLRTILRFLSTNLKEQLKITNTIIFQQQQEKNILNEINRKQEELIKSYQEQGHNLERPIDISLPDEKKGVFPIELLEVISNNKCIDIINSQLQNEREHISNNKILVYESNKLNAEFPIQEILGKLIGRKNNTKKEEYKQIILSCLNINDDIPSIDIQFKKVITSSDKSFVVIILIVNCIISPKAQGIIRKRLRNKILEIIDRPLTNDLPPFTVYSNSRTGGNDILDKLNTETNVFKIKKFIVDEYGISVDNLLHVEFLNVKKVKSSKKPLYTVVLSLQVKMFIFKNYKKREPQKDILHNLLVKKEANIIEKLKHRTQEMINNH